jgi:hypothetical protein
MMIETVTSRVKSLAHWKPGAFLDPFALRVPPQLRMRCPGIFQIAGATGLMDDY